MSETTTWHVVRDGLTIHQLAAPLNGRKVLHPGELALVAAVASRGDEVTVTPELIEATKDRWGESAYADLSDQSQIQRWGTVYLQPGTVNEGLARQLAAEADSKAAAERQSRKLEAARYGRHLAPTEDEVLAAADLIRARRDGARQ
ncbi:MAG: hypothetical protein JWQ89_4307 [Devosia sp.]|uniref:hypothetical protein n=1 Tax=Devosia sp. TaxID=1871048 RepID=UPI00262E76C0|nr:hypothetical protein [Devosia sp.]MDB5542580.1 hypothetical protein [Devosia sp.]